LFASGKQEIFRDGSNILTKHSERLKKGGGILTHSPTPKFKPSDGDLAYEILAAQARPMYYYDLIREVLSRQELPLEPAYISGVLTQINLDTRFSYLGKGEWGLKVWVPTRGSRRLPTITLMNKELVYDDESHDLDLEKDPLDLDEDSDEEIEINKINPFDNEDYNEGNDDQEDESW
jgi:DNA-directed RNA polymerase subunit delta